MEYYVLADLEVIEPERCCNDIEQYSRSFLIKYVQTWAVWLQIMGVFTLLTTNAYLLNTTLTGLMGWRSHCCMGCHWPCANTHHLCRELKSQFHFCDIRAAGHIYCLGHFMLEQTGFTMQSQMVGHFHIAIMSADCFFCAGVEAILRQYPLKSVQLHFCHTLRELQGLLTKQFIHGVVMEEFGEGENMMDWLPFSHFLRTCRPSLTVLMLLPASRIRPSSNHQGWISKHASVSDLRSYLKRMAEGSLRGQYMTDWGKSLTVKERLVLHLLCQGWRQTTISKQLCLSPKTVSAHKRSALRKLDVAEFSLLIMRYRGVFQHNTLACMQDARLVAELSVA